MDQLSLYNNILQLSKPWSTTSVELIESDDLVLVTVSCDQNLQLQCPKCNALCDRYDSRKRRWRHLDTCQYKTVIESDVPRVKCAEHGILTVQVPWADESSRYSAIFERSVLQWAHESSILSLSRRLRLSWTAINGIMYRGVKRGLDRRWKVNCQHLSVDETCIGKKRDFITVLSNSDGQVIAVTDGRSGDSLLQCFATIPIQYLNKIRSISMDMSPAYRKAVYDFFGARADKLIAFDHFHITKLLTTALNQIRRDELNSIPSLSRMYFHKTRYVWLRNGQKLSGENAETLESLKGQLINTATAWYFKEQAREIWHTKDKGGALRAWKQWLKLVNESSLLPLKTVASTIKDNLKGILNSIRKGVSNARAEAINKNIKNIARRAHGYRNRERYKTAIMFYFGKLEVYP